MSKGPLSGLLRHIRRIAFAAEAADLDDARLLELFIAHRDEAAFEALLRRHGPMVLGVCRRLLRDPHDSEDAFQATFLVLLQKASSLRKREQVAPWLYGVAYRTALKARAQRARRNVRAKPLVDLPAPESAHKVEGDDLRAVIDEEVQRLPAKYRAPVVLCYLEGKTFEEAARQLGWPAGTVSGRLARARQLLRTRLTRRGLGLSVGLLDTAFSHTASRSMPCQLISAMVRAALALTTSQAAVELVIPTSVVTLMEGVLHAMFLSKLKLAATFLLLVAVVGGGAGVMTYQELAAQPPNQKGAETPKAVGPVQPDLDDLLDKEVGAGKALFTPKDKLKAMLEATDLGKEMKSLLLARVDAAATETKTRFLEYMAGRGTLDIVLGASRRLRDAERDLSTKKADQILAWEAHLQRMQIIYDTNLDRFNAGRISLGDLKVAEYYLLDAQIGLKRAKAQTH
jgi:RNA polymerase sigma factor (sigma-70 family)